MPLPASNSLNSLIINSDGIRAERSILFVACTWTLQHWLKKKKKKNWRHRLYQSTAERMETWCIAIIHYQLVSLNFHCSHTHRHIAGEHTKRYASAHTRTGEKKSINTPQTQSYTCCKHPFLPLFPLCPCLWWDRGCHAVTVRGRRTNKCFPPRRCDLNGKATWQLCSERPHNQTPHPLLHTATSVWEAFPLPASCK